MTTVKKMEFIIHLKALNAMVYRYSLTKINLTTWRTKCAW